MNLYPAIDLYEGQVVRLEKGDFSKKTVYSSDPVAFAREWQEEGAQWLHVVDLEGAKTGIQKNLKPLQEIRKSVSCKIQFGGGLRSLDSIRAILDQGIDRVVVGTKAMDRIFLEKASRDFPAQLAVGLDVRDGVVQTQGWLNSGNPTLQDALHFLHNFSIEVLIYTDIHKDGMLQGPNLNELAHILDQTKSGVILSGGIGSLRDIHEALQLTQSNFEGIIIGKALYEKKLRLIDACQILQQFRGLN